MNITHYGLNVQAPVCYPQISRLNLEQIKHSGGRFLIPMHQYGVPHCPADERGANIWLQRVLAPSLKLSTAPLCL